MSDSRNLEIDNTPEGIDLDHRPPPVRRLSRWPWIVLLCAALIAVGLFAHAVKQRQQRTLAAYSEEMKPREAETNSPQKLIAGQPDVIEAIHKEEELFARMVDDEAVPMTASESSSESAPVSPTAPPPAAKDSLLDQQRERYQARRLEAYYSALEAPVAVAFGIDAASRQQPLQAPRAGQPARPYPAGFRPPGAAPYPGGEPDPNRQDRKEAFLTRERAKTQVISQRDFPLTQFEVKTGTVIPAVLLTGINSDLPGEIKAQVSQNVYDTATGHYLLIPQGTVLVGHYDSQVAYGQERVLVVWHRLVLPDASTMELQGMPGADAAGYAGYRDKVNNHWGRIIGAVALSAILSAGTQTAAGNVGGFHPTIEQQIAANIGRDLNRAGQRITEKSLNIQPSLMIRPGYKFNVFVNKDLRFFESYSNE